MKRKEFLMTSGMLATAAMVSNFSAGCANERTNQVDVKARRPDPAAFREPILQALTLGINAPNPHNSQVWKFRILNDHEALFYVDEKKILPATDPPVRQIHIGCGCFIALFKIGAGSLGFDGVVDYLPEGSYAFSDVGVKPVAKLSLVKSNSAADPLFKHIYTRQTNRLPYTGAMITQQEFESVLQLAKPANSNIRMFNDAEALKPLLEVLYKGMEAECYDWDAYDESRRWFRVKDDIEAKRDGINLRTNGVTGVKRWIAEMMLSGYSKKAWHDEGSIYSYLKSHYDAVMASKGIVVFITETNTLSDWLRCGEDYARFQLSACEQEFYIHPLSQVLQEFASMKALHDEFNMMMKVVEPSKIQMVVRIGRGNPVEYAYRKNTTDLTSPH